jgi:crotonobetainyl-CoA:carnitine CoA-transferase CaiB-like acyl-CoA transferase
MLLGDLGSDVIKVERPGRGDDTREWGPPFDDRGESAYYLSINRNKLSIAGDLRATADREVLKRLISGADVVVENFLPGALTRAGAGLNAQSAIEQNHRLIWCTITGFGAESRRPGYDFVVQAEAGWMAITGESDGPPLKAGVALADVIAGKDAAIAILAALAGRSREVPVDRHIVISLADSARAALVNVAQNSLLTGTDARRWGNAHANLVPYQLFQARDRAIVIAVGNDDQWLACARALGLPELEKHTRLAANSGRLEHRDRVVGIIQRAVAQRPAADWIRALDAAKVPCGVVKSVLEAIQDAAEASPLTGMPSSVGGRVRFPPPRLDEHGDVIRERGWDAFRYRE